MPASRPFSSLRSAARLAGFCAYSRSTGRIWAAAGRAAAIAIATRSTNREDLSANCMILSSWQNRDCRTTPISAARLAHQRASNSIPVFGVDSLDSLRTQSSKLDGGYTSGMKTAVYVPDDVFEKVERLARRYRKSQSEVFCAAIRVYVTHYLTVEVSVL